VIAVSPVDGGAGLLARPAADARTACPPVRYRS